MARFGPAQVLWLCALTQLIDMSICIYNYLDEDRQESMYLWTTDIFVNNAK